MRKVSTTRNHIKKGSTRTGTTDTEHAVNNVEKLKGAKPKEANGALSIQGQHRGPRGGGGRTACYSLAPSP